MTSRPASPLLLLGFLLLALLLPSASWGACTTIVANTGCDPGSGRWNIDYTPCKSFLKVVENTCRPECQNVVVGAGSRNYDCDIRSIVDCGAGYNNARVEVFYCTTPQEACDSSGGHWNAQTQECEEQATPDFATDSARCENQTQGLGQFKPQYDYTGAYAGGYCDLCDVDMLERRTRALRQSCCDKFKIPIDSLSGCYNSPNNFFSDFTNSVTCMEIMRTETGGYDPSELAAYADACPSQNNNYSSAGGSSSSAGSSSSEGYSASDSTGSPTDWRDSLHKIIVSDSAIRQNTDFIAMCLANPEVFCPSLIPNIQQGGGDTTIVNIAGDTIIVNGGSDSLHLKELERVLGDSLHSLRATARDSLHNIRLLLDSIDGKLDTSFGGDSLGLVAEMLRIFSGWGDSVSAWLGSDSGDIGKALGMHGDTLDGWSDNALDTMSTAFGAAVRGGLDSMGIQDTLNNWLGKFNTDRLGNGDGSTCPNLLTRTYTLQIGGASVQVGSIGGYLCTPVAGMSLTLWTLAVAFLKLSVSIGCFFYLFSIATSGGKESE